MQKEIFFSAFKIYLNAFSDVAEIPSPSDWPELRRLVREKMLALEKYLEVEEFGAHANTLTDHLNQVMTLCRPDRQCSIQEFQLCIAHLTEMAVAAARVRSHHEVAKDRRQRSMDLMRTRQKGRDQGPQAQRKKLVLAEYSRKRQEFDGAHAAATGLLDRAKEIAKGVGYPLAEGRAHKTVYEWFQEYDAEHPRNE